MKSILLLVSAQQLSGLPAYSIANVVSDKSFASDEWQGAATVLSIEIWDKLLLSRFVQGDDLEAEVGMSRP